MAKGTKKGSLCRRCIYRSGKAGVNECDYCFLTGRARGCPGDENCARFEEGPRINVPLTLPGPVPAERRMAEKMLAEYELRRRQRIYGYKEALHSAAEEKK